MIITDIRRDFFDKLEGRILILCAYDVDAICACKILQFLLELNYGQYTVVPVSSIEDLSKTFEEFRNTIDSLITINFGNLINFVQLLKPPKHLKFYIIDSHRPINVHNFYMNQQVKLFINKNESDLNIPSKRKVFLRNDTDGTISMENEEEHLALLTANARDLTTEQLEKRRKIREWLVEKQKLLFDYEEFHYYKKAVSILMYELAYYLSKNNNYLLWLGIIGLTFQLKSDKIDDELFEHEADKLIRHISRNQVSGSNSRGNDWTISYQMDLKSDLYRKWTVFDSLSYFPLTVCQLQLWNDKGRRNLYEFLAEAGLPLVQAKQVYRVMDLECRSELLEKLGIPCFGDNQFKYNLQSLISKEFVMKCGLSSIKTYAASDFVLSIRALLESIGDVKKTMTPAEKFDRTMRSLSYDNGNDFGLIEVGFEEAKIQLKSMFEQVTALITTMKVTDSGTFLHVDLEDNSSMSMNFACGNSLVSFARFLLSAYVASKKTKLARRAAQLPLILLSPDYNNRDQVLIVGVPPLAQEKKRNFFYKAFEQAAANIDCELKYDLSETNLVRTSMNYKNQLLDQIKILFD